MKLAIAVLDDGPRVDIEPELGHSPRFGLRLGRKAQKSGFRHAVGGLVGQGDGDGQRIAFDSVCRYDGSGRAQFFVRFGFAPGRNNYRIRRPRNARPVGRKNRRTGGGGVFETGLAVVLHAPAIAGREIAILIGLEIAGVVALIGEGKQA